MPNTVLDLYRLLSDGITKRNITVNIIIGIVYISGTGISYIRETGGKR